MKSGWIPHDCKYFFNVYLQYSARKRNVLSINAILACLLRILALREVKESKLLLAFGQCIMKLFGSNIIFKTETNFEN